MLINAKINRNINNHHNNPATTIVKKGTVVVVITTHSIETRPQTKAELCVNSSNFIRYSKKKECIKLGLQGANRIMASIETIDILRVVAICAFAGGTSFAGGLLARYINFSDRQVLFFTAFGAGILISAAIFGMVIEAEKTLGIIMTLSAFVAGSIIFTLADVIAERKGGGAGILLGIGLDSIPESLAIGASIAGVYWICYCIAYWHTKCSRRNCFLS